MFPHYWRKVFVSCSVPSLQLTAYRRATPQSWSTKKKLLVRADCGSVPHASALFLCRLNIPFPLYLRRNIKLKGCGSSEISSTQSCPQVWIGDGTVKNGFLAPHTVLQEFFFFLVRRHPEVLQATL